MGDVIEFCARHVPQWNTVSISGYHIREAGSTAAQELAFTLADGFHYVEHCLERGLDVDDFAPRLCFFFNAHNDLFEEIAKYRAARRSGPRRMRERYGAKSEESWKLRFHAQTAGCSLQAQQPEVNLDPRRLPGAGGGARAAASRCTPTAWTRRSPCRPSTPSRSPCARSRSWPTRPASPTPSIRSAAATSSRTLTNRLRREARTTSTASTQLGGMIAAIEAGFFRREIADAAFAYQREVDADAS